MKSNKFTVLLTLAVFTFVVEADCETITDDDDKPYPETEALLVKLAHNVDKSVLKAHQLLDKIKYTLQLYGLRHEYEGFITMQKNQIPLQNELSYLKYEATQKEININECLIDNEKNFDNIVTIYNASLRNCVNAVLVTNSGRIETALSEIQSEIDKEITIIEEAQQCRSLHPKATRKCLTELLPKVHVCLSTLAGQITSKSTAAANHMESYQTRIDECFDTAIITFKSEESLLFNTIKMCIKNKIDHF